MTSRERVQAAASGLQVDRKPVFCWPSTCAETDIVVDRQAEDKISLKAVLNPFGQALRQQVPLWEILESDPQEGERVLHGFATKTKAEIREASEQGYDGVLYQLLGATPEHTTPMEYGGHYLEKDREVLTEAEEGFNAVLVLGASCYLEFVSDLPAQLFAWCSTPEGPTVAQIRALRNGAIMTNAPDADVELRTSSEEATEAALIKTYAL